MLREPLHHRHVTGILPKWDFCNGLYRRPVFPGIAEIGIECKSLYPTGYKTYCVVKGVGRQGRRIKVEDFTVITLEDARHHAKSLVGPVSYTHLDVYKRQPIHRSLSLQPFGESAGVGPQRIDMVNLAPEQRVGQQEVADLGPFQGCLLYTSRCV